MLVLFILLVLSLFVGLLVYLDELSRNKYVERKEHDQRFIIQRNIFKE